MDWSLKIAVVIFSISLGVVVVFGIAAIWFGDAMSWSATMAIWKMSYSSLLLLLGSGSYIALRDAMKRIRSET